MTTGEENHPPPRFPPMARMIHTPENLVKRGICVKLSTVEQGLP